MGAQRPFLGEWGKASEAPGAWVPEWELTWTGVWEEGQCRGEGARAGAVAWGVGPRVREGRKQR